MLISNPGLEDWKKAVGHAAKIIAGKYFPEAERPLDEAALGPLLTQSQIWIKSLCKTEKNTSGEKISQNTDTITLSHEILHRYLAAQTGANLRKNLGYVSLDEMAFNDLSRGKEVLTSWNRHRCGMDGVQEGFYQLHLSLLL